MSEPLIALRYDVSQKIGMGHASRARILATALADRGVSVVHAVPGDAIPLLQDWAGADARFVAVDAANDAWHKQQKMVSDIVVDTLWNTNAISANREVQTMNTVSKARVTVIDSMPPDHFVCSNCKVHALLTPYLDAEKYRPPPPKKTLWLNSPMYSLLGPEYEELKEESLSRTQSPSILISCGGSDTDRLTESLVKCLLEHQVALNVAVGPLFHAEHVAALESLAQNHPQINLHFKPTSLAPLIAHASLVVGRPGLLRYEAAALGRPAVYLAKGFAYRDYYRGFNNTGVATIFFDTDIEGVDDFSRYIKRLAESIKTDSFIRNNAIASSLVDTNGAKRFVDALLD